MKFSTKTRKSIFRAMIILFYSYYGPSLCGDLNHMLKIELKPWLFLVFSEKPREPIGEI